MAGRRTFAALLDQDSVAILEFWQEKAGFRLGESRSRQQRFPTPEAAADAVVDLLGEMKAKNASLSIVLQHFGSFFHTLVLPPAAPEQLRPIIQREVQRSFNIADPAVAFTTGPAIERRDPSRTGGQVPNQVFVAGAPRSVVESLLARFAKARLRVEGLTVVPEVFRRLYDALDGSTEATAVLICLHNGPHVAFFVNGQLELAIEPPLALDGEAPLDAAVIIDQLERGAIFLRQQARGTVATRLLLAAPSADYETLASTVEARTGMRVAPLGTGIGSPESVVAMGAVLSAREENRLDLVPRAPGLDERLKTAMTGSALVATSLLTAAAVAAFWAGLQFMTVRREQSELARVQTQVERGLPALASARLTAQGRERIASIRAAFRVATNEKARLNDLMSRIASVSPDGTQLDSLRVDRTDSGLQTTLFGHASAATGPLAVTAVNAFYRQFKAMPDLKQVEILSNYGARPTGVPIATPGEDLHFKLSFLTPVEGQ